MIHREYHYLVAGLPDFVFDDKKAVLTPLEFKELLGGSLHPSDFELIRLFCLAFDNQNVLSFLKLRKHEFNPLGNYSITEIEEEIIRQNTEVEEDSIFPDYIVQFIAAYREGTPIYEGLSWENQLITMYYNHVMQCKNVFLKNWFEFELNVTNILVAINSRNYRINPEYQIIGDSPVSALLRRNQSKDFGLGIEFPEVEKLQQIAALPKIIDRERNLDLLKWHYLDEATAFHYFDIELIISYFIKLIIVDRWLKLDEETGRKMFKQILSDIEKSHEFPEEFKI
jgi:hypothetical protein